MKGGRLILFATAALTGRELMAWYETSPKNDTLHFNGSRLLPGAPAVSAQYALHPPGKGIAELSRVAALIRDVPEQEVNATRVRVESWPPGTARAFAMAMLIERSGAACGSAGGSTENAVPAYNRFRELAEGMAGGRIPDSGSITSGELQAGFQTLKDWVGMDPAAATNAILKMPEGNTRNNAVDAAVETMSKTDPLAAMEFLFKSGDPHPGSGAAAAWQELILGNLPVPDALKIQSGFLARMSRQQRDSLFTALAERAWNEDDKAWSKLPDDSNVNCKDPLRQSDLALLARSVLEAREVTPGFEAFFQNLAQHPRPAQEVLSLESLTDTPAGRAAKEILDAHRLEDFAEPGRVDSMLFENGGTASPALDRAAPGILGRLTAAGRLSDALILFNRVGDPGARLASLEALLPAWMDADPAAARAAFNAAPFTALERERLERRPAFMMHPAR